MAAADTGESECDMVAAASSSAEGSNASGSAPPACECGARYVNTTTHRLAHSSSPPSPHTSPPSSAFRCYQRLLLWPACCDCRRCRERRWHDDTCIICCWGEQCRQHNSWHGAEQWGRPSAFTHARTRQRRRRRQVCQAPTRRCAHSSRLPYLCLGTNPLFTGSAAFVGNTHWSHSRCHHKRGYFRHNKLRC